MFVINRLVSQNHFVTKGSGAYTSTFDLHMTKIKMKLKYKLIKCRVPEKGDPAGERIEGLLSAH